MPTDTEAVAQDFIARLGDAESRRDPAALLPVFADGAELSNLAKPDPVRGADAARQFWADYLAAFGTVRSEFTHVTTGGPTAVLEWVSDGTLPTGRPIRYRGVSVLEVAGGRVARFRTYYDTAAFVAPVAGPTHDDQPPAAPNA